jgi:hypothetical protein
MKKRVATAVLSLLAIAALAAWPALAEACPTCKDSLAHDPAAAGMVRGYAYSILFMLSMPPLIFGSLCAYFYWEVRRARAQAAAEQGKPAELAVE